VQSIPLDGSAIFQEKGVNLRPSNPSTSMAGSGQEQIIQESKQQMTEKLQILSGASLESKEKKCISFSKNILFYK